ncbi:MAG: hypothetical protein ACK5PS_15560 [Desulfopila sp.]
MSIFPEIFPNLDPQLLQAESLGLARRLAQAGRSPFCDDDSSVGMEYELQVAVEGVPAKVDLPLTIRDSTLYRNTQKRAERGDLPRSSLAELRDFLGSDLAVIWENSWVRCAPRYLGPFAAEVLASDFLADKSNPNSPVRQDLHRFQITDAGRPMLRLPISYLLKLALADTLDPAYDLAPELRQTGTRLLDHFLSDNTSPEILSLTIPTAKSGRIGHLAARETARTFLLCQLLCQYANSQFGLTESGQRCLIYNAPQAPLRIKRLNELVPDSYYRQLFISPCLSGWARGEEKYRYMSLCHQVLSRSQLNTIGKLKDAGIITNNLVVLPNTSNTCLANNGTHVSLGSRMLTELAAEPASGFHPGVEKYLGDLVTKIVEHFLPLMVGTYSAAPYRIDFADFHPEKILGFLPHELDYTHLRMLWRRWKKKADNRFFGHSLTPFGPRNLDRLLATVLQLHGDLIADFRLIDYFITLLSTASAPALNGLAGNQVRLKSELSEMGIFDSRMSIYLPYRMRAYQQQGYSGFEGRNYSLFPNFMSDMAEAVNLQNLITALAYRMALQGAIGHGDIPDEPSVESERRQLFFAAAIGLPTVYIRHDTGNTLLRRIVARVRTTRASRRYKGYLRVPVADYRLALLDFLSQEAGELVDRQGLAGDIQQLRTRLTDPDQAAWGRLVARTREQLGTNRPAGRISAETFNRATEHLYRTELRQEQLAEGYMVLTEDCLRLERRAPELVRGILSSAQMASPLYNTLRRLEPDLLQETVPPTVLRKIIHLVIAVIHQDSKQGDQPR